jgi:hypothetical protein
MFLNNFFWRPLSKVIPLTKYLINLFYGNEGQSLRVLEGCVLSAIDDIGVLCPAATSYWISTFPVRLHFPYTEKLIFTYKGFVAWDTSEGCTQRSFPEPKPKSKCRKWNQRRTLWCNQARGFPMAALSANLVHWQCQGVQVCPSFQCLGREGRRVEVGSIEIVTICYISVFINQWAADLCLRGPPVE